MSRYIEASNALEKTIYRKIRNLILIRYFVALCSSFSFVLAFIFVWDEISPYLGIFLEQKAFAFWKEILLSVTEALPFLATLALFISLTLMLWSITNIYDYKKRYI